MSSPLVSVVMPVHNGMPYLPETMTSLLGQTFRDFELVFVDDGSTDDTPAYVRELNDPRVMYYRLEKAGLVGALNHGLDQARGKLIARADGDDVYHPDRLAEQVRYMAAHPECVLLGCDFVETDPDGRVIAVNPFNVCGDRPLRWLLSFATPFLHPGAMYPVEACRRIGGYNRQPNVTEDYDLWSRLCRLGPVASLPSTLVRKRIHPKAYSLVHMEPGLIESSRIAARHSASVLPDIDQDAAADLYWLFHRGTVRYSTPGRAAAAYRRLLATYQAAAPTDPELESAVGYMGRALGFACSQQARRNWKKPWRMAGWMRAAGAFDPNQGNPLRTLARKLTRAGTAFDPLRNCVLPDTRRPEWAA